MSKKTRYKSYKSSDLQPGKWAVVTRAAVLSWKPDQPMPEFRQVISDGGMVWVEMTEAQMVLGRTLENIVIVSHRWFSLDHPDWDPDEKGNQSSKLRKLQQLLQDDPSIEGVWLDFVGVPQGFNYGERDKYEQAYFRYTLDNIKLLYLTDRKSVV